MHRRDMHWRVWQSLWDGHPHHRRPHMRRPHVPHLRHVRPVRRLMVVGHHPGHPMSRHGSRRSTTHRIRLGAVSVGAPGHHVSGHGTAMQVRWRTVHRRVRCRVLGRVLLGIFRSVMRMHWSAISVAVLMHHPQLGRVRICTLRGPSRPPTRPPPAPTANKAHLRVILLLESTHIILMPLDGFGLSLAVPRARLRANGRVSHHSLGVDVPVEKRPTHV